MPDKCWKACERRVAHILGGRRTGPSGRTGPDVVSDWLSVEVKTRRHLPAWLLAALQQARTGCPESRLPLVILHRVGGRHEDDLVILGLGDFAEWFGPVPPAEAPHG